MSTTAHRLRLAAIDLDGTLLGPDHTISPANARAVQRLQADGIEVVLASGRHYGAMVEYGRALPGVRWMVSAQGAEVSSVDRSRVLHQSFLDAAITERVLALSRKLNFPAIVYTRDGIMTDSDEGVAAYDSLFGYKPERVDADEFRRRPVFKVVWAGEPERLIRLAEDPDIAPVPTDKLRSHLHLLEFVQRGVSKATGLGTLAAELGIAAQDAVVFGDADNDVPMFAWAGTSVAMPHAWPSARAAAKMVAPDGPPEEAVARGVEAVLGAAR
jgi:Cof subfamily protein (haloacid dehalogenase superfamily)